jgi:hypothetical protein
MKRVAVGIGVVALLGLVAWLLGALQETADGPSLDLIANRKPETNAPHSPKASSASTAQSEAGSKQPAPTTPSGAAPRWYAVSGDLGRRLLDTENYRQFVKNALDSPEKGGYYYAVQAHLHCIQFTTTARVFGASPGAPQTTGRIQALELARDTVRRCEDLAAQFGGDVPLGRLALRRPAGQDSPDPLMRISEAAQVSKADQAAMRGIWSQARDTGEPTLIRELMQAPSIHALVGLPLYNPDDSVDRRLASYAAMMVGCELVGDCVKSAVAVNGCLASEACTSTDLREQVRASVPESHRTKLNAFVDALRAAVR